MLDLNSPVYDRIDFNTPIYTQIDFNSVVYDDINFNAAIYTEIKLNSLVYDEINLNNPVYTLILNDLDIPEFLTDDTAIATLAPSQAYQLTVSRQIKVTPAGLFTNLWANFSKAFSYIRRAF